MSQYRHQLPQLDSQLFLTDGGLETTMVFHEGLELPYFAAFDLVKDEAGRAILKRYFETYLSIASRHRLGFMLDAPTWRANTDWAARMGYSDSALAEANRRSISLLAELRKEHEAPDMPIVISGTIGPRGDGYCADIRMSAETAQAYHRAQIDTFANTDADLVSAFTLNYVDEAVGILHAARETGMPAVISFTVETDGHLPSGETLPEAIQRTDIETDGYALYYMINCAHPTHFTPVLSPNSAWVKRIKGLRANASCSSHAELDQAIELDEGSPVELGRQYAQLLQQYPQVRIVGGCCGTNHRHLEEIARATVQFATNGQP